MTDDYERPRSLLAFASGCIAGDAVDRRGRAADGAGPGAGAVSRQGALGGHPGSAPGLAADGAGLLPAPAPGSSSPVGHWLEQTLGVTLVFHWSGAVVASAVAAFPLFLLPARGAFEAIDPALEDVARLLGRSELSVFLAVTLPLAWRGLAAGIVLAFARALGDFGATLMVAGNIPGLTQTAALAIYDARAGQRRRPRRLADALDLGGLDPGASGRSAHPAGARAHAVSDRRPARSWMCRLVHRVHPGLVARCLAPARPRDRRRVRAVGSRQDDLAAADRGTDDARLGSMSASRARPSSTPSGGSISRCAGDGSA